VKRGEPLKRKSPLRATPPNPEVRLERARRAADRERQRRADKAPEAAARARKIRQERALARASQGSPPKARTVPARPVKTRASQGSPGKTRSASEDPVTPVTRAAVAARSGGYCEARVADRCRGVGQHMHHRKLRRHGDHRPANLLHVCHACHAAIHSSPFAREAYARRFLLRSHMDPVAEPVRVAA
jgi:hypothetical protein